MPRAEASPPSWEPTGHRLLVTGFSGLVGSSIVAAIEEDHVEGISRGVTEPSGVDLGAVTSYALDLSRCSRDELLEVMRLSAPTLVIHLAAAADVDWCQKHPLAAARANVRGTRLLAESCLSLGIPMGLCSTDYVFPRNGGAFREGDPRRVITDGTGCIKNVYSWTKIEAEIAVEDILYPMGLGFIFRVSFPYNPEYRRKPGTPVIALNILASGQRWTALSDIRMSVTPVKWLGHALNRLIQSEIWKWPQPIIHCAGPEILGGLELVEICASELKRRGISVDIGSQVSICGVEDFFTRRELAPRQVDGGLNTELLQSVDIHLPPLRQEIRTFPLTH